MSEEEKAFTDAILHGTGFLKDGEHIPFDDARMTIPPEVTEREAVARAIWDRCREHFDPPELNEVDWCDIADAAILAMQSAPSPDVMAERLTLWLYQREGGVIFDALPYADQLAWAKQGRDGIEAALGQPLPLPPVDQKK